MSYDDKDEEKQTMFREDSEESAKPSTSGNQQTSSGLDQNIAGLLCYIAGFVTGIVFLVIEKENRFVRYHAMQSIIVFVGLLILDIICTIIPIIGWILLPFVSILSVVLWVLLMFKAYSGSWVKIPIAGEMAEKQLKI